MNRHFLTLLHLPSEIKLLFKLTLKPRLDAQLFIFLTLTRPSQTVMKQSICIDPRLIRHLVVRDVDWFYTNHSLRDLK